MPSRSTTKSLIWWSLPVLAGAVIAIVAFWPNIEFYSLTGRFFPIKIVEKLNNPVAVLGWSPDGLVLASGEICRLPGMEELPRESRALAWATGFGIETTPDGRVIGLIRVHHGCGNDPVREHIVRVDLSDLLIFCQEIAPAASDDCTRYMLSTDRLPSPDEQFDEFGWHDGCECRYRDWLKFCRGGKH